MSFRSPLFITIEILKYKKVRKDESPDALLLGNVEVDLLLCILLSKDKVEISKKIFFEQISRKGTSAVRVSV